MHVQPPLPWLSIDDQYSLLLRNKPSLVILEVAKKLLRQSRCVCIEFPRAEPIIESLVCSTFDETNTAEPNRSC